MFQLPRIQFYTNKTKRKKDDILGALKLGGLLAHEPSQALEPRALGMQTGR